MAANYGSWASSSQFSSFWAHHEAAEKWRRRHAEMVRESCAAAEISEPAEQLSNSFTVPQDVLQVVKQAPVEVETYVEESMEIDPEYVEFKRITIEHQERCAESRREEEKKQKGDHWITVNNEDFILADKIGVYGVQKATLEAPDERSKWQEKRDKAKEMYGPAAEKLLAMETALDVQFGELMNSRQPPLWPIIPLRF